MSTAIDPATADLLRRWNLTAAACHLAQALAIVALSSDFALPVTASYLGGDPAVLVDPSGSEVLFDVRTGWAVAAFSFLSAAAHLSVAGPVRGGYLRWLAVGQNPYRWVEYSLSASLMMVVIAQLVGIFDVAALAGIVLATAATMWFGWLMERTNGLRPDVDWTPFVLGSITGVVPWILVAVYLFGAADPPGFVYGIFISIFVAFNAFPLNMVVHYRRRGRWAEPLFAERGYIVLSFTAKSALAWQVFGGTLR